MLVYAGDVSKNTGISKAIAAFRALVPEMRKSLVAAIEIIERRAAHWRHGVADRRGDSHDRTARKIGARREQLEGWWWPRICSALQAETPGTIPVLEVEQKLDDIRDSLKRDALPLDMEDVDPSQEDLATLDEMRFVRQLQSIALGPTRLQYAKRDFYRASAQRSQWARHNLVIDGEVARFDRTLIEEWQPRFAEMCESLVKGYHEAAVREAGHKLYAWVETDARFPLRTTISRFLNVGSYHILADDLRVGWHRDYQNLCGDQDDGGSDGG